MFEPLLKCTKCMFQVIWWNFSYHKLEVKVINSDPVTSC